MRAVLALVVVCSLAMTGTGARAGAEPFDPLGAAAIDPPPNAAAPLDLPLYDSAGRRVTLRTLAADKPIVLAPVQHQCPNICGLTLEGLTTAIGGQSYKPGPDFTLVALGIDPREGSAEARVSLARLPQSAGVSALVGSAANVRALTQAIGYRYAWDPRIGQYAHIAAVAVLTPDGRLARWIRGVAPDPQDLNLAITEAGEGRTGGFGDRIRLLCYHYDPETGRYSTRIWIAMRGLGLALVAAIAIALAFATLRERRRAQDGHP